MTKVHATTQSAWLIVIGLVFVILLTLSSVDTAKKSEYYKKHSHTLDSLLHAERHELDSLLYVIEAAVQRHDSLPSHRNVDERIGHLELLMDSVWRHH